MAYTLTDIVNEMLVEMGEGQQNKFSRFYQFGLSFLRKTNFNTTGQYSKVIELIINPNDTADLPLDYVRYTRIALCCNGRLYSLGLDESLCLNKLYDNCGVPVAHSGVGANGSNNQNLTILEGNYFIGNPLIADNFVNGEFVGRMFGIGADNNAYGYYRIDTTSGQILFANLLQTSSIVLEYLADVSLAQASGDFEVHPFAIEALKDWIQWKYKERSSKPLGEQAMARENFYNSNRLMRLMFNSSTKEEWVAAFATTNQATPKM